MKTSPEAPNEIPTRAGCIWVGIVLAPQNISMNRVRWKGEGQLE